MDARFLRRSICSSRAMEMKPATMQITRMAVATTNSSNDCREEPASSSWASSLPLRVTALLSASPQASGERRCCRRCSFLLLLSSGASKGPLLELRAVHPRQRAHGDGAHLFHGSRLDDDHPVVVDKDVAVQRLAGPCHWRLGFWCGRSGFLGWRIGASRGAASAHVAATCCRLAGWPQQLSPKRRRSRTWAAAKALTTAAVAATAATVLLLPSSLYEELKSGTDSSR